MEKRIKYLESLLPKDIDIETKWENSFAKYATYQGNGIYQWHGILSKDTRELFLMGCLFREKIKFIMK